MFTSKRPYFVRCWYDWMSDNHLTPYVVVQATSRRVQVPREYVENDRIVLNISSQAVREFSMTIQTIQFKADFDLPVGIFQIVLPMSTIVAIYAKENNQGMFFTDTSEFTSEMDFLSERASPEFTIVD